MNVRIEPLPVDHAPDLKDAFAAYTKALGFIANSMLILLRKPKIVKTMAQLAASIWEPDGEVDRAFKRAGRARCEPRRRLPVLHGAHRRRRAARAHEHR